MNAFETKDLHSLGMIELPKGQKVKVTIAGGRKVLEKIDDTIDDIAELIPLGQQILNKIISIFNNISFELPCVLVHEGNEYIKTEQIARGSAVDKIFYQSEAYASYDDDGGKIIAYRIYEIEAPTIAQARSMMRKKLREENWIK